MAADTNMFERITQRIAEKVFDRNKFHYDEPVHRELMRTMTAQITTAIKELAEHIPEQRALVPLCGRLVIVYTGICEAKFDTVVNYIQKDEKGFALSKTLTKLSVEKCVALYKQYMEGNYNYTKANQPATATSDSQDKTAGKASPKPKTKRTPSQTTAKRKSEKSEAASAKPETPSTAKKEAPPPKKAKPRSMSARGSKAQGYTEGEADVIGIVRINEDEEDDQTFGQFSVAARSNVKDRYMVRPEQIQPTLNSLAKDQSIEIQAGGPVTRILTFATEVYIRNILDLAYRQACNSLPLEQSCTYADLHPDPDEQAMLAHGLAMRFGAGAGVEELKAALPDQGVSSSPVTHSQRQAWRRLTLRVADVLQAAKKVHARAEDLPRRHLLYDGLDEYSEALACGPGWRMEQNR